jgi:cell division protein FtsQ
LTKKEKNTVLKVLKIIFRLVTIVVLFGYLVFAFRYLTGKGDKSTCVAVNVKICNEERGFVKKDEIIHTIQEAQVYPVGKGMDKISSKAIERSLQQNPYISEVICYKSPGGNVNILVDQYIPIMRVMPDSGTSFYLDQAGRCLPTMNYCENLLVATGSIDSTYAKKDLVKLARFVYDNYFWNKQLEQVHINPDGKVDVYPRIGKQIIRFGYIEKVEKKFENLKLFYDRVMPVVGWNKYYELNIAYTNQVIGKKEVKKKK